MTADVKKWDKGNKSKKKIKIKIKKIRKSPKTAWTFRHKENSAMQMLENDLCCCAVLHQYIHQCLHTLAHQFVRRQIFMLQLKFTSYLDWNDWIESRHIISSQNKLLLYAFLKFYISIHTISDYCMVTWSTYISFWDGKYDTNMRFTRSYSKRDILHLNISISIFSGDESIRI